MAQKKLLFIDSDGIPLEHTAANDDITFKSFTVAGGGPVISASGIDMNSQKIVDVGAAADPGDVVSLNGSSKIDAIYLPSYVDDVLEYANLAAFPGTGSQGIIYVALDTNKTYRWSGSAYVEISPSEVNSVNGETGIVVLDTGDISENGNLYFTASRAQEAVLDQSLVAGENLAATDPVYVSSAGEVSKADAAVIAKAGVVGFAKASASAAASVAVRTMGLLSGLSSRTPGARQYLASGGGFTESAPTGAGNTIVQLGYALSATSMLIQIASLGRRA